MEKDIIIISKVLNGDANAFEEIIESYNNRILSFICKMGINAEDSKDLTQEVFIKAYNNLYRYNKIWKFSTWLFTIATNITKDFFKSKKIASHYMNKLNNSTKDSSYKEPLVNLELKEFIQDMLNVLDDDVKAMLILFYYLDLPHKEIANIFHTKPGIVKMKIHRARKKICDQFGKRWEDEYHV
jgi:RNA polymerase sigma-70 factor (ECF subfamily)